MSPSNARCALLAVICTALLALTPSAFGAAQVRHGNGAATVSGTAPIVVTHGGAVRGVAVAGGYAFRGLPYAAAPTGDLRWRPPRFPDAAIPGVVDGKVLTQSIGTRWPPGTSPACRSSTA